MFTVVETTLFQKQWPHYWTEEDRGEFAAYVASTPDAGVVVPGSGGIRKVRWKRSGSGKSGGVRVIYFARNEAEEVVLLTLYAKSELDNLTGPELKEIRRALED
jgi:hypothetical protein